MEWMVESASWLAPLLVGVAVLFHGSTWGRELWKAACARWQERTQRANMQFERDWRDLSAASESAHDLQRVQAFFREPSCEAVVVGQSVRPVIWAELTDDAPSDHSAINEMVQVLLHQMNHHMTSRVVLRVSRDAPSSRRFWMALRHLGHQCAIPGGVLVILLPGSSTAWGEPGRDTSPWYIVAPREASRSECLTLAATATKIPPAEPPDLEP